jgi:hypothetical protein
MTSGAAASGGAQATMNPENDINPYEMVLPAVMGGGFGAFSGFPQFSANRQLKATNRAREVNPMSADNPKGIRSPEQVGEIGKQFPENSIDLASLAGNKKGAEFYSDVLGRLPFTGVRKAEEKAIKTFKDISKANSNAWTKFRKNSSDSDVVVNYNPLFEKLNEKYGSFAGTKGIKTKQSKAEEDFLSNLSPMHKESVMKQLGKNEGGISEDAKRKLLHVNKVSPLKEINLDGDKLDRALDIYQSLGELVRSTKKPSLKSKIKNSQLLMKERIEDSLVKSGRQDLLKEWMAVNKSHINKLETKKVLKNAYERQGETFSNSLAKKAFGSPTGKAIQLGVMGSLGLLSPVAMGAAATGNLLGGLSAKVARSKSLRDAYVSGRGVNEKNLSKEIFPIWMRALGVGVKQLPKIPANIAAEGTKKRRENEHFY